MPSYPNNNGSTPARTGRRKKPDWGEFYKNGLPKEVIVIDDTPTPEPQNGETGTQAGSSTVTATSGTTVQPAGKKRRTGVETAYDLGYYDRPSYSINPQHYGDDSSGASISTDRTTSLQTTAPHRLDLMAVQAGATVFTMKMPM
jgi:dual-specificity kinase